MRSSQIVGCSQELGQQHASRPGMIGGRLRQACGYVESAPHKHTFVACRISCMGLMMTTCLGYRCCGTALRMERSLQANPGSGSFRYSSSGNLGFPSAWQVPRPQSSFMPAKRARTGSRARRNDQ